MCKREIISFSERSKTYPDLDGLNSITEFNWEDVLESTAQLKTVVAACRGGLSAKTDKRYQVQLKQAFREFLVSLALISNLNGHKSVELSHVKCKILTFYDVSYLFPLVFI